MADTHADVSTNDETSPAGTAAVETESFETEAFETASGDTVPARTVWHELRTWPARRWWFALATAVATTVLVAIPTVLIPNPWFAREFPPTAWAWPVLVVTSVLAGLLAATYVARKDVPSTARAGVLGTTGAVAGFFAVGCPVCNKLVLLALGYTGALQFFEPAQPFLAAGSIILLAVAFVQRIRKERVCPVPAARSARARR